MLFRSHGIWINQDVAQRLQQFPMDFGLGEILLDLAQNETRLETDRGLFFVFAGSQMVKNAKTLEDGYEHIQKKREELIKSGILEEQDQFYIFKTYYAFSSPSLAASVLLGENVNGLLFFNSFFLAGFLRDGLGRVALVCSRSTSWRSVRLMLLTISTDLAIRRALVLIQVN